MNEQLAKNKIALKMFKGLIFMMKSLTVLLRKKMCSHLTLCPLKFTQREQTIDVSK